MKVNELIKELQAIKDQNRQVEILIGGHDEDLYSTSNIELHHTLDNDEQTVEIFGFIGGL
jgi:hypothetical protein